MPDIIEKLPPNMRVMKEKDLKSQPAKPSPEEYRRMRELYEKERARERNERNKKVIKV